MKSYTFLNKLALALSMLFVLSITSCTKEDVAVKQPEQAASAGLIKVTGEDAGSGLKSTLSGNVTSWVAGDKVGIYSPEARTATSGGGSAIVNAEYIANASGAQSSFTGAAAMYWGAPSTTHNFYAYYPWTTGSPSSTVVPVALAASQTQSSGGNSLHIGALDFMVATPKPVVSPANTDAIANEVNLKYNHLFTVLEFNIRGTGTIQKIRLTTSGDPIAFSSGTVDITQSPVLNSPYTILSQTGTSNVIDLTLTAAATLSAADTKLYMVINPGAQTGNCTIGISANGTDFTNISKAVPTGGFVRGKKYTIAIASDADGNYYNAVTIGTQVWMAENLKTTKYNDGTPIPNVTGYTAWTLLSAGAYCWYNTGTEGSPVYDYTYGALYNWYAIDNNAATKAASNGDKNVCPLGWHVPSDPEWTDLITYLGGVDVAGGKLKETGNSHWSAPNTGADNSSGFTALPGGYRDYSDGISYYINIVGNFWSTTGISAATSYDLSTVFDLNRVWQDEVGKAAGFSVRCVRN